MITKNDRLGKIGEKLTIIEFLKRGIDVWVVCDRIDINFPVPYLNNYTIYGVGDWNRDWFRGLLNTYLEGKKFGFYDHFKFICPYDDCGAIFNFWPTIRKNTVKKVPCPTCLKPLVFDKGWPII